MRMVFGVAICCLTATTATAQNTQAPDAAAAADKKICRRVDETGSIRSRRICHTRAEWVAIDQQNEDNAHDALTNRRTGQGNAGPL